ncbi:hypothetical protein BKA65DRAFT_566658 [Rhexocercosporidium sp. MPI-PUGE-AT-0058]|nr:hypothetical protein BKA65DRAFT_566658 [Rhexocercosporidium sp. MPI-PUGE-AT-0058]
MLGPHMTGSNIWGTIIVTLSFSKTYLLHAIFALSALHLAFLHSADTDSHQQNLVERYLHLATLYQTKCITLFRREIADLSASNSAACAACASFLSLIVWATPGARGADLFLPSDTSSPASLNKQSSGESLCSTQPESNLKSRNKSVPWYKIQRGGHHIVSKTYDWVSASAYHDIVGPWREINYDHIFRYPLSTPISTISSSDAHNLADITSCWSDAELSDEDIQALEETLQTLHYVFNLLSLASTSSGIILPTPPTQISASIAALSWTTLLPSRFCDMVEDRIPQALILVAVYCVVLKRAEDLWWIKGKAESLLAAVGQELGGDGLWNKWLEWPRAEVEGC